MFRKSLFARIFGRSAGNGNGGATATATRRPRDVIADELPDLPELQELDEFEERADRPDRSTSDNGPRTQERRAEALEPDPGPPVRAEEMPQSEEVDLRIREGIKGISNVLTGIDRKIDRQQKNSDELMVTVRKIPDMMKDVPDASKAGLELLATISAVLENQGRATGELMEQMKDLPSAIARVETNATEASRRTRESVDQAVAAMQTRVDSLDTNHERRQQEMLGELRKRQVEHDRHIDQLLRKSNNATRLVVFLIVVVIAALLLVVQAVAS